jgi:hypothetical protein
MIPMPPRIEKLPRDERGYPIPWNVLRDVDGKPIFTANDSAKHMRAIYEALCPICGERTGKWKWFVGGPNPLSIRMAGISICLGTESAWNTRSKCVLIWRQRTTPTGSTL